MRLKGYTALSITRPGETTYLVSKKVRCHSLIQPTAPSTSSTLKFLRMSGGRTRITTNSVPLQGPRFCKTSAQRWTKLHIKIKNAQKRKVLTIQPSTCIAGRVPYTLRFFRWGPPDLPLRATVVKYFTFFFCFSRIFHTPAFRDAASDIRMR